METSFINSYEITEQIYLYKCNNPITQQEKKEYKNWKTKIIADMFIISNAIWIGYIVNEKMWSLIAIGLLCILVYNYKTKRAYKNKQKYKKILKEKTVDKWIKAITFGENIKEKENETENTHKYQDFTNLSEDESFYYLWKNENYVISISKTSFIKGKK